MYIISHQDQSLILIKYHLPGMGISIEISVLVLEPNVDIIQSQLLLLGLENGLKYFFKPSFRNGAFVVFTSRIKEAYVREGRLSFSSASSSGPGEDWFSD